MLLSQLLNAVPEAALEGSDVDITGITHDSRQAATGMLFVAVPSVGGDAQSGGARFIPDVLRAGAAAIVTESQTEIRDVTAVRVRDARGALAALSAAFYADPSAHLQLYAVTGTDGKTTTTYLLEQVFAYAGYRTGMIGTVESKIGDERTRNPDRMTTPESLEVQRLLRRMVDGGVTHAVIEASSHALALQRLRGCQLAACAVTNITGDHVEFHGSWEAYFLAKATLLTDVGAGRPAVLNRDDPSFERLAALASGPVIGYSTRADADVRATGAGSTPDGTEFLLSVGGRSAPVRLAMPGLYNVSNALAAASLATCAGLEVEAIAEGLSHAFAPPGRLQRVSTVQPFDVLIDYAHTMHAFQSVLSTIRDRTPGRLIVVFGAAGNRDRAKRPEFARIASQYADLAIVTNEDPFGEEPEAIIDEVLAGATGRAQRARFVREPDRGRAIELALTSASRGDAVLILGKGHEESIVVDGRSEPWSDVSVATRILEALR